MWRIYFSIQRQTRENDRITVSPATARICDVCSRVLSARFTSLDQEILEMFFTTGWGDSVYAVEDYSLRRNIPTTVIYKIVRKANRAVMEDLGILDRKD